MTMRQWMTMLVTAGFLTTTCLAQDPVITSFQGNGQLSWTNPVDTNAMYRVEWAAQAGGPWYRTLDHVGLIDGLNATGFTVNVPMFYRVVMTTNPPPSGMAWIEGGDVELGQAGIAEPVHTNTISGFWMDTSEVTRSMWEDVTNWASANGYDIAAFDAVGRTNNNPIVVVSWYSCVKWCNARSQKEGLTPCYYTDTAFSNLYKSGDLDISNTWVNWNATGYRLPTEAEWEKAARGGRRGKLFPWGGDSVQHARANYYVLHFGTNVFYPYDTSPTTNYHPNYYSGSGFENIFTSPVGSFPVNGFGLHDMAGNAAEWCWDWYGDYVATHQTDPRGPDSGQYGRYRVVRGGAFHSPASELRVASRVNIAPDDVAAGWGFRCVRGP